MAGIILVPMFASALRNDELQHVVPASIDFARLPWSDGQHDHNAGHPYLSLSVLNPPFASDHFALHPGTHLHWMLPSIYRRGFLDQSEREHIYCPAPNFWLVRRTQGREEEIWVVESDVLMQPTHFQHASGSIMPYTEVPGTPPFRMIGRMMPLDRWKNQTETPNRYANLTAMGYGDGTFASYYPACGRCFGFHDMDHSDVETTYEVMGWRRELGQNLLHWLTTKTLLGKQQTLAELFDDQLFTERAGKERKNALDWKLVSAKGKATSSQPTVDDIVVCYTRLTVTDTQSSQPHSRSSSAISVGNNASNALTAHLVEETLQKQSTTLTRQQLEEQLDHLSVDAATLRGKSDKYFKFLEQRHQESFVGVPGGIRWSLRNDPPRGAADAVGSTKRMDQTTPQRFGAQVGEINKLQAHHDQAVQRLTDLQEQLFAEWHHYQLAMYPANLHSGIHQNADEIRHYIESETLPRIELLQREIDRLAFKFAKDQSLTHVDIQDRSTSQHVADQDAVSQDVSNDDAMAAHSVEGLSEGLNTLLSELTLYNDTFICGQLHGGITFGNTRSVRRFLQLNGGDDYVQLEHIDGLRGALLHKDNPLSEFVIIFRLKVNAGEGGVILSFDPATWFEVEVPAKGTAAGKLVFTAADTNGETHRVESSVPAATGRWERIVIRLRQGKLSMQVGAKVEETESPWLIGGAGTRRGYLGASTTTVPFTDDQDVHPGFTGALTGLRMVIGPIEEARMKALLDPKDRPHFSLHQTAATRYWQPREPAVAVVGEDAQNSDLRPTEHHYPHNPLHCIYLEHFPVNLFDVDGQAANRDSIEGLLAELMAIVDSAKHDPNGFGLNRSNGDSWHPILAEWEVGLYPLAINDLHNGRSNQYASDFVERAYELARESVDLTLRPAGHPLARTESFLTGRTIINPNHAHALRDKLNAFIEAHNGDVPAELKQALQHLDEDDSRTLTFPLEGFVAAMRQKLQILQLPIDDPLAFADYRDFTERVHQAVGDARTLSPDPIFDFNPIQSGAMEVRRLRLIDNFGQHRDQAVNQVRCISTLRADDHSNLITLPARLAQPARLEFRWLEAASRAAEASEHVDSSPICGWLTVNDLDGLIAVHDETGHPLGALTSDSDLLWQPLPGMDQAVAPAMFGNATLRKTVEWLTRQGGPTIDLFARMLDHALDNIHPENFGANEWTLMSGRPLAIVQVKLGLLLKGLPAIDQSYGSLYQTLATGDHHNADFEAVRFPVRLGDHRQVNDGLVGYWLQDEEGGLDGLFHAPNAGSVRNAKLDAGLPAESDLPIVGDHEPPLIPLSINEPEKMLTLLFDPRGHLLATSGILPAKALTLPENFYLDALARMRPAFFTAPVLTPSDKLTLPLPRQHGLHWDWLEKRKEAWTRIDQAAIGEPEKVASTGSGQEIREGWLELNSRAQ